MFFEARGRATIPVTSTASHIVLRRNSCSIYKKKLRLDADTFSFGNRVINEWNKLQDSFILKKSINAYKSKLDTVRHDIKTGQGIEINCFFPPVLPLAKRWIADSGGNLVRS